MFILKARQTYNVISSSYNVKRLGETKILKYLFFVALVAFIFQLAARKQVEREGKRCDKRFWSRDSIPGPPGRGQKPPYMSHALKPVHQQPHPNVFLFYC
ncbi:hypothetical protein ILYODFUR_013336 [Ilyodon furcidens]|uniref:Uncharacterized protein n=1 Tax=Ilyodon furcidens TaxID=33524 RepID=A0ABV0USZ5_9TELE